MKRMLLCLSCLALMMPFKAKAQDRGEISVFGGYSESREVFSPWMYGWNASIAGNIMKHLALVADFSGYSGKETNYKYSNYSCLFGPRYVHRIGKRWSPFAHALFGLYHRTQNPSGLSAGYNVSSSRNFFGLGGGGGIDLRANYRISVRVFQLDVVRSSDGHWGYGRISFGAVFHLNGAHE